RRVKDRIGLHRHILPARTILLLDVPNDLGLVVAVIIELVTAKDVGRTRELMIDPAHEEILPDNILGRADKFSYVQIIARAAVLEDLSVRVGIILEEGNDSRVRRYYIGPK